MTLQSVSAAIPIQGDLGVRPTYARQDNGRLTVHRPPESTGLIELHLPVRFYFVNEGRSP